MLKNYMVGQGLKFYLMMKLNLQDLLITEDNINICYLLEIDLKKPDEMKKKTKRSLFCPENSFSP